MRGRRTLVAALVALAVGAAAAAEPLYEGYDAFWATRPDPLFTAPDEKPLDDPQSLDRQEFRAWGALAPDGAHRIEILGSVVTIDRRAFAFAPARAFPGELPAEPGADERLFVSARNVCVQGTAPTSSGTAQRHVHVVLVIDAFTPRARRHDLPSLFGSCLALGRDVRGGVRFPAASLARDGVVFRIWRLHGGRFSATGDALRLRFPKPDDVYRFTVVAP